MTEKLPKEAFKGLRALTHRNPAALKHVGNGLAFPLTDSKFWPKPPKKNYRR